MVGELITYIKKNKLFAPGDSILLAVSGGIDSMVMVDLFHRAGFNFGIAHCNFSLRNEESDADEQFVRDVAAKLKVLFCTKKFDTAGYAAEKGISIQMAARELRYEWFRRTSEEKGFDYIATAHHQDDQTETFFINLTRQSGISGFHGIFPKKGKVIRPLLFCDREKIAEYAASRKIEYREDSSNRETKYLRNKIRHEVLPVFREINPEISTIITSNIQRIRDAEIIFRKYIDQERKKIVKKKKENFHISIESLKELDPLKTFLFEFLCPFGFNYTVASEIESTLDGDPGSTWYSANYRLIRDRKELIITPFPEIIEERNFSIHPETKKISEPVPMSFSLLHRDQKLKIDGSPEMAHLDFEKLEFPLKIRKWQKGDIFHPFGNGHKKKISDFFTDNKFSLADKENTWLLCSGDSIVWVIGHRIDHRFRITSSTKEVYMIKCRS